MPCQWCGGYHTEIARTAGRAGRPWRTLQAQVYAEETHCYGCGNYVDQTLPNYRPGPGWPPVSRWARSVHHIISREAAPCLALQRSNVALVHIRCNTVMGAPGLLPGGAQQGVPPVGAAPEGATSTGEPHGVPVNGGHRQGRALVTSRVW